MADRRIQPRRRKLKLQSADPGQSLAPRGVRRAATPTQPEEPSEPSVPVADIAMDFSAMRYMLMAVNRRPAGPEEPPYRHEAFVKADGRTIRFVYDTLAWEREQDWDRIVSESQVPLNMGTILVFLESPDGRANMITAAARVTELECVVAAGAAYPCLRGELIVMSGGGYGSTLLAATKARTPVEISPLLDIRGDCCRNFIARPQPSR